MRCPVTIDLNGSYKNPCALKTDDDPPMILQGRALECQLQSMGVTDARTLCKVRDYIMYLQKELLLLAEKAEEFEGVFTRDVDGVFLLGPVSVRCKADPDLRRVRVMQLDGGYGVPLDPDLGPHGGVLVGRDGAADAQKAAGGGDGVIAHGAVSGKEPRRKSRQNQLTKKR